MRARGPSRDPSRTPPPRASPGRPVPPREGLCQRAGPRARPEEGCAGHPRRRETLQRVGAAGDPWPLGPQPPCVSPQWGDERPTRRVLEAGPAAAARLPGAGSAPGSQTVSLLLTARLSGLGPDWGSGHRSLARGPGRSWLGRPSVGARVPRPTPQAALQGLEHEEAACSPRRRTCPPRPHSAGEPGESSRGLGGGARRAPCRLWLHCP